MALRIIVKDPNISHDENKLFKTYFTEVIHDLFKEKLYRIDMLYVFLNVEIDLTFRNILSEEAKLLTLDKCLSYVEEIDKKLSLKNSDFLKIIRCEGEVTNAFRNAESLYLSSILQLIFSAYRLNKNQFDAAIQHFNRSGYFEGAAYHNPSDYMIAKLEKELGLKIKQETGRKGGKVKGKRYDPQKQIVQRAIDEKFPHSMAKLARELMKNEEITVGYSTVYDWIRSYIKEKK